MHILIRTLAALALLPSLAVAQALPSPRMATPTDAAQATSKSYVDGLLSGKLGTGGGILGGPLQQLINPSGSAAICKGNRAQLTTRNSAMTHDQVMISLFGPTGHSCDGLQAILETVPGSTATQSNAVSGYIYNMNGNSAGQFANGVGVALNGGVVNGADGTQSWLLAGVATDAAGAAGPVGRLLQSEFDYKPQSINTQVVGFLMAMDSPVQPANADGWVIASTYGNPTFPAGANVGRWSNGFRCYAGSVAGSCVTIGLSQATAASVPANALSQILAFTFTDAAAKEQLATLTAGPQSLSVGRVDGTLYDLATSGMLEAGTGVQVGAKTVVRDRQPGWAAPTGTVARTSLNTATATTQQVAQTLAALLNDLTTHGLIGP